MSDSGMCSMSDVSSKVDAKTLEPTAMMPVTVKSEHGTKKLSLVLHKLDPKLKLYDIVFKCKKCDELLGTASLLRFHYRRLHTFRKFGCHLCDKRFHHRHTLTQHVDFKHASENGQMKKHRCNKCELSFASRQSLYRHYKSTHIPRKRTTTKLYDICGENSGGKIICKVCEQVFNQRSALRVHFDLFHQVGKERQYKCQSCESSFNIKDNFRRHLKSHSVSEGNFFCIHCSKVFSSEKKLQVHVKDEHSTERSQLKSAAKKQRARPRFKQLRPTGSLRNQIKSKRSCDECDKVFNTRQDYVKHVDLMHQPEIEKKKTHACNQCPRSFNILQNINSHMSREHKGTSVQSSQCDVCNIKFSTLGSFLLHKDWKHSKESGALEKYQCGQCSQSYRYKENLERHKAVVHCSKSYKCTPCDRTFFYRRSLQKHNDFSHKNDDVKLKHACDKCSKSFKMLDNLRRHKIFAHSDKPSVKNARNNSSSPKRRIVRTKIDRDELGTYTCKVCFKGSSSLNCYRLHKDYYHGQDNGIIKRYRCDKCAISFDLKQNITRHVQTHNSSPQKKVKKDKRSKRSMKSEEEFTCKYCGLEFFSSQGARMHEDVGHEPFSDEVRRYKCSLCTSSFNYRPNLKRHLHKCLQEDSKSNAGKKDETMTRRSIRNLMKTESEWKDDFDLEDYDIKVEEEED